MKRFHLPLPLLALVLLALITPSIIFSAPVSATSLDQATTLLKRARAACGGEGWGKVTAISFEASENSAGMQGTQRGFDDVKTGRMRRESDFHVIKSAEVWDGNHHWRQDKSGGVHELNSEFAQQANATDEWLARRAYLKPDADGAQLGPVENRSEAGSTYSVVTATPQHGQPVELWFETATGFLSRTVRIMPTNVETVSYANYKQVAGVLLPHRIITDDESGDLDTVEISAYHLNSPIKDSTFEPPQVPADTTVANGKVTLPVEIGLYVTLEAKLNGQGPFAFLFDTGGHNILTPEAAAALGLHPAGAGSSGGAGEGTLTEQYAKVERMEIGGVSFRDQNFTVLPLQYITVARGDRPPLAGILGLEILERLAMRIDYRNRSVTFWPRETYRHQGPGIAVPITFADDIPLLHAQVGDQSGDFALDTGNDGWLVIQHVWAGNHGLTDQMKSGLQNIASGTGGEFHGWTTRIPDFELAGQSFHHILASYFEGLKGAFSSRTEAGNIGTQVLANFALDFDYANSRIWFEFIPGFTPMPYPRTDLSLNQLDPQTVIVAFVLDKGPAAQAGLRQGDTVITIDGKKASSLSPEQISDIVTQAPGTSVSIVYKHKGEKEEVQTVLVLRELLP